MTVSEQPQAVPGPENAQDQLSLAPAGARQLTTTTKSVPQMQAISSRWLLRLLPWIQVSGGTYRVNRRLSYEVGDGRITFTTMDDQIRVIPRELTELPVLRGFDDEDVLSALADRFEQRDYEAGDVIAEFGQVSDEVVLIAHGKVNQIGTGRYGAETVLGALADGDHFGDETLTDPQSLREYTVRAVAPCTVLCLPRRDVDEVLEQAPELREHIERFRADLDRDRNEYGEAPIDLASGHEGERDLPGTYVDYETQPREYGLSVAQTVLRVHSRVADLYNDPMNQVEQQLRLTLEALKERQEHELVNNREFGLLHNAALKQRIHTRTGPPTPDDFDELLSLVWKEPAFFLAHPRTISAFGQECTRRGVYPTSVDIGGSQLPAWRGIPIFPCGKIPISETSTSSVLLMRTGEESQGVIGLHQTGIPDEYQPSVSVRFMGINEKAIISYLVSAYYSCAVLVPDALAVLENAEIGRVD